MHRHSGDRRWRESPARSDPGTRITVPPHLRRRSRGCENTCHHATKENEFSPVHSVIRFQRLKPRASKVAALENIKDGDRVPNAPPLGRLRQSVKLPGTYNSLNSLLEKVTPVLVVHDEQGKPHTVRYDAMNAMLLNEFPKEHRKVQEQERRLRS